MREIKVLKATQMDDIDKNARHRGTLDADSDLEKQVQIFRSSQGQHVSVITKLVEEVKALRLRVIALEKQNMHDG